MHHNIPNWLRENMHIFCNKMSGTVGVITHCSVNSERCLDALLSEMCALLGMLFCFLFSPFVQTIAVQPNSIHLNGRFINV